MQRKPSGFHPHDCYMYGRRAILLNGHKPSALRLNSMTLSTEDRQNNYLYKFSGHLISAK